MMSTLNKYILLTLFLSLGFSQSLKAQEEVQLFIVDYPNHDLRMKIEQIGTDLLNTLNKAVSDNQIPDFVDISPILKRKILEMWETAPMYIPENKVILTLNKLTNDLFEIRGIPLILLDGEIENYEEAILLFNQNGSIVDFRLSLPMHQYASLMQQGQDVEDMNRRKDIIGFTEDLRTAYNRKDLNFINQVFSDQALVIVGHVTQSTDSSSAYEKQIEYLRFNKQEYIDRLERVFDSNEYIDVEFDKIDIFRHNIYKDVYGVNLNQYYKSTTYKDEGYLFLLVDFKDPEKPMIHVRVWQPLQNTPESRLFTMGEIELF